MLRHVEQFAHREASHISHAWACVLANHGVVMATSMARLHKRGCSADLGTAAATRPGERGERRGGRRGGGVPAVGHEHQRGSPERKGVREGEIRGTATARKR